MCQLWNTDEAPGPAVTHTVQTFSPCLQDVPRGSITLMPMLALRVQKEKERALPRPEVQGREGPTSPPLLQPKEAQLQSRLAR